MAVLELQRKIYPGINYSDSDFRTEETRHLELNIFLNDSQFLFSVVEPVGRVVRHIQSFNFFQVNNNKELADSLRNIFETEDLLHHEFKAVNLAIYNDYNTLIAAELFDERALHDYLFLNFDRDAEPEPFYDAITSAGIMNVYGIDRFLKNAIEQKFGNAIIAHSSTYLIEHLINESKEKSDLVVYVYVQPKILQVISLHKGQLKLFNSFSYTTPEDFIYYILYVCQHLQLDPETLQLILLGEIVKDSALYEYTYKYIRNVQFGKRPEVVKVDPAFKMPSHFYFNLFCMNAL